MSDERFMRHHYGPSGYVPPGDANARNECVECVRLRSINAELLAALEDMLAWSCLSEFEKGRAKPIDGLHSDDYVKRKAHAAVARANRSQPARPKEHP